MSAPLRLIGAVSLLALGACSMTPAYETPTLKSAPPAQFKALEGWKTATPSDHIDRGDWWTLLGDPQLNALAERVKVDNQTIAAAEAAYRQARALVRQQRASLFPSIDLSGSASKSGGGGTKTTTSAGGATSAGDTQRYQVGIGASWEPDVWGRIRAGISGAKASAEASEADLAAARLSAQGELATSYLGLRRADAEIAMVQATVEGYQRALQITTNRYNAAIAPKSDVLQAQTQLASAQSTLEGLVQDRTAFENAIAVLVGEPASSFRLAADATWKPVVPEIPVGVPSTLLERRPDVAAAERRVAAANSDIGVARAAFFPTFNLSANGNSTASKISDLFAASANTWSLGLTAAQTLFDAGARRAQVAQSRAAYDQAAASYRLTALQAFEDVENQLTAARTLERQYALQLTASQAADQTEQMLLNQYRAGQVAYTDVVAAQASALAARRTLVTTAVSRQTTAVALVQALGGGWR
ncbi:efflux transporter outer membrane subunit [Caulobacter sp. RL271]|uniref:Efflux transporter outer membrane subunit n=1 Tax=Caulobacter segnis TaxID=88688 RepID=A0ABY4ZPQ5_9CAUL|nr:efflux transporter outer membrane subunit [Caulobacter segnis]USQ94777.1 efflux transporter outer membrane subunit [Caulobacter segnis]